MFPFQWEGVVPLLRVALGFSAASLGALSHSPAKVHKHFVLLVFPSYNGGSACLLQGWHKDHKREVVIVK